MGFEYTTLDLTGGRDAVIQSLNDLGKDGWELVSVVYQDAGLVYLANSPRPVAYFKRPLPCMSQT